MAPVIRLDRLVKSFGTDGLAVDQLSLEVQRGEVFAFLGPNGAGKTTTIRMLTTLLKPTSGVVEIAGIDCVLNKLEARRQFGVVFQDSSLDQDLTAMENMRLHAILYKVPRDIRSERTERLLRLFDLWDRRDVIAKNFSGGLKRRLEIARGLLHTPKILFMDEPTLGLDPQSRGRLWTQVRELNTLENVTVFLTTHYMEEAERVATRVGIIDHGKLVAVGTVKELKEQSASESLEESFLQLTGHSIRDEDADGADNTRNMARLWGK
jgi:ABC-2 type transport system ATP-binding protein